MSTDSLLKQLSHAFLSAFDRSSLEIFLSETLDERLENLVASGDFRAEVYGLLTWAQRQGRIEELVRAAAVERPGNADLQRVAERVAAGDSAPGSDRPDDASSHWVVPYQRNLYFTGRQAVIERLHEALHQEGSAALGQAISGLGGIGKTQTALEYCYRYRETYRAIFWVRAETEAEWVEGVAEVARVLDLPEKDAQDQGEVVEAVRRWLGRHESWLLVFDNADTPELVLPLLPTAPRGHVLLTSRAQNFDALHIEPLKLGLMSAEEAVSFLLRRVRRGGSFEEGNLPAEEARAAQTLAEALGYLPLALEQAGAYISLHDSRFVDYLASYRRRRLRLLSQGPLRDYREPLATTWSLNFEQLAETSEASAEVLRLSAFLAPDQIPEELLIQGAQALGPALSEALEGAADDPLVVGEILQPLGRYSLIERDREHQAFSVHRMVQEVLIQSLDEAMRRELLDRLLEALSRTYPGEDVSAWASCDRLVPHWQVAAEHIDTYGVQSEAAGYMLNQAGFYARQRARYTEAAVLYRRALDIREAVLGANHPDVALSLNNLATLYQDQGDDSVARPLLERALVIRETMRDPEALANSLNNLANLYRVQGDNAAATPLLERALEILEATLGSDHPYAALCLANLAAVHQDQGDHEKARLLLERALEIREAALGNEHPDVASNLNNLASIHYDQGDYATAAPLYERALEIRETVLGSDHPNVAQSLNGLGMLHLAQGDYAIAEPLLKRALEIREAVLGIDHPAVALSLNGLAMLHYMQGETEEVAPLFERALEILKLRLGPDHPEVATVRKNYRLLQGSPR